MKEKWLMALGSFVEVKPCITTALEYGFDCVLVDKENIQRVKELGTMNLACFWKKKVNYEISVIGKERRRKRNYSHS